MSENTRDIAVQNQQRIIGLEDKVDAGFAELKGMLSNIQQNTAYASGELGRKLDVAQYREDLEELSKWRQQTDQQITITNEQIKFFLKVFAGIGTIFTLLANFLWDWWKSR